MCNLCDQDEAVVNVEIKKILCQAEKLEGLAMLYKKLAYGEIKPHSDKSNQIGLTARLVIRGLVDEWV